MIWTKQQKKVHVHTKFSFSCIKCAIEREENKEEKFQNIIFNEQIFQKDAPECPMELMWFSKKKHTEKFKIQISLFPYIKNSAHIWICLFGAFLTLDVLEFSLYGHGFQESFFHFSITCDNKRRMIDSEGVMKIN